MSDIARANAFAVELAELEKRGGDFVKAVAVTRMPMVFTDAQGPGVPISYANPAFLKLLGLSSEDVIGRSYVELAEEHTVSERPGFVEGLLASHISSTHEILLLRVDGREVWVSQFLDPVVADGVIVRHFISYFEITERVQREAELRGETGALERRINARNHRLQQATVRLEEEVEKRRVAEITLRSALDQRQADLHFQTFLLREVNHRTANAFHLAIGLLQRQGLRAGQVTRDALMLAEQRLLRIAEVHSFLIYRAGRRGLVNVSDYLEHLCNNMLEAQANEGVRIVLQISVGKEIDLEPDFALSLGLIVNEAMTNAFKYAFPDSRRGRIAVLFREGSMGMELTIDDDGAGLSATRPHSLGLSLIETAAKRLSGEVSFGSAPHGSGTRVKVVFQTPR